jgi:uncharacterized protein YjbI with pentapeptide repeats
MPPIGHNARHATKLLCNRLHSTLRERVSPVWESAMIRLEPGLRWLKLRPKVVFWAGGISIALAFLVFSGATAAGAALLAWAALRQASTASDRHQEQTNADRQRRITESFSKAVEQLGSDKLEVRLGGIYSLERILKESPDDYWTVMENLAAFIRERSQRNERERLYVDWEERVRKRAYFLWLAADKPEGQSEQHSAEALRLEKQGERPAADIAAALTVILRRSELNREREDTNAWHFNLTDAVLRRAALRAGHFKNVTLVDAHLEGAYLVDARLEGANLWGVHLDGAKLTSAHLEKARLIGAHLEEAHLVDAHLDGAYLVDARLEGANLWGAHLDGANLTRAHLEGAILLGAHLNGTSFFDAKFDDRTDVRGVDFSQADLDGMEQLRRAKANASTRPPAGFERPAHWSNTAPDEDEDSVCNA